MKSMGFLVSVFVLLVATASFSQSISDPTYMLDTYGLEPNYRDQDGFGTCWTFGTMSSVESNLIKAGYLPQNTPGLSERDLAWHSGYSGGVDPLNGGGSYMLSSAYFARGDGPLTNAQAPYWSDPSGTGGTRLADTDPYPNSTTPTPAGSRQSRPLASYYVRDIDWLHSRNDIKSALLSNGAVATCWAVYAPGEVFTYPSGYPFATYQPTDPGPGQPDHSVAIVGWDDNVECGAPGKGGWVIRNSWGTSYQHFAMSYYDYSGGGNDPTPGSQNMGAVSFHNVVPNTYQEIYYHNDLGWTSQQNHAYALNHFTADQNGLLKSVSFYTTDDNVGYTVSIYKQFQAGGDLGQLVTSASGTISHEGFHTVDLSSLVPLAKDENFYIELQTSNGWQANDGNTDVTVVTGGSADPYVTTTALAGESYFSDDGHTWTDLHTVDASANFAINGLTIVPEPGTVALLSAGLLSLAFAAWRRRSR
jgi:C1A family cysteine protease